MTKVKSYFKTKNKTLIAIRYSLFADQGGLALVESLVAMSVLMVGLVAIMSLVSRSLSANRVIEDQYIASYLAAEGIEVIKNLVDSNKIRGLPWTTGVSPGTYGVDFETVWNLACAGPKPNGPCSCPGGNCRQLTFNAAAGLYEYIATGVPPDPFEQKFNRALTINQISADEMQVIATVSWVSRGGGTFSLSVYDHFFDWRP